VDYTRPVEALIPGVQGRVLGVLARTTSELTMRAVAELAGVSPQQASVVLGRLVELGIVERRDVPPVALVRLTRDNLAAQSVVSIAELHRVAVDRLVALAAAINPAPASLVLFGSFARAEATTGSDVDVLAVRPLGLSSADDAWTDSLGSWTDQASRALGNPVNVVEAAAEEVPTLLRRKTPSLWRDIATEGIVLAGASLDELGTTARHAS
jgi:predicted nucleotidyltransferase/DNA-binding transcriptional ArsR family regulator